MRLRLSSRFPAMSSIASIRLAPAAKTDLDALLALCAAAGADDPVATAQACARLKADFNVDHTTHIVVYGKRVGMVVARPEGTAVRVEHLYIHPDYQRQGIGAAVLNRIVARGDAKGTPVRVRLPLDSQARRFFQREGFDYVSDDGVGIEYVRYPQR